MYYSVKPRQCKLQDSQNQMLFGALIHAQRTSSLSCEWNTPLFPAVTVLVWTKIVISFVIVLVQLGIDTCILENMY